MWGDMDKFLSFLGNCSFLNLFSNIFKIKFKLVPNFISHLI